MRFIGKPPKHTMERFTMARMTPRTETETIPALQRMLATRGLDVRDFEIEEDTRSGISQLLGLAGGIVSLKRRSTGEIRVYATGPGSAWYAAICADFDRGYFKAATLPRAASRRDGAALSALWV